MKMKNIKLIFILTVLVLITFFIEKNFAQVSRSTGLGFRAGFWEGISAGEAGLAEVVAASPVGELYFFSRLKGNWFLEASLGDYNEQLSYHERFRNIWLNAVKFFIANPNDAQR